MVAQPNKRPPRQPLSPEEVMNFIRLKKHRKLKAIEHFKTTQRYKLLNCFNIFCIVIYSELIIAFMGSCNYNGHYIKLTDAFFSRDSKGDKRVCSSIVLTTVNDRIYDVSINDTITPPDAKQFPRFLVGKDWILQKEVTVKLAGSTSSFVIKDSFSILFISVLLGVTTFISFGFNLNQVKYSLMATSMMNGISVLSFLFL